MTAASGTSIGLALGGGGARGLAHIAVIEVLDELGLRPAVIAGTSMGAIIGAAHAAGIGGRDLRRHVQDTLRDRTAVLTRLLQARVGRLSQLFARGHANPVLIDGEKFLDLFWPQSVPERFEDLAVPLLVVATDYYARSEVVIGAGALVSAVAGSMAIPGLVRPVVAGGRVLIDGGATNPLPFDHLLPRADVVIAVDVVGGAARETDGVPDPIETMFGASHIMQAAIVAGKLAAGPPHIMVRPPVGAFRGLDFFKAKAIFAAADLVKDGLKRDIAAALEARA
ncbi:Predicted acylesterase/phospholipase RssA, containd patatin domain [Chelatococcus sambhunathii]|uniref:Patatin n=2 Tax=Chelatococcus TaxID=28209 RepID=A0AAC9JN42_9HYPH|nr:MULTISPECIES: patatin-like phospholipase family protein [Chelatococcus]APF36837.1 patatin [Chelatococcus daeguensis]CUA88322.1 Predicted acylesterase/phospholipase RssA, containd patatin domain [Chelatococcus sambhunathii]